MIQLYKEKGDCCGCTACRNICPSHSIRMEADQEGFLYPVINPNTCTSCKACIKVCAFHKKEQRTKIPEGQEVYGVKHRDENVRLRSSSGAAFTAVSDYVLNQGGAVYGAAFDENFKVIHGRAVNAVQRDKMRGSKYVQSDLGEIFKDIKEVLNTGIMVLFTGTPCQNAGLTRFLGREYQNLILCDIACHGVPSPKVWEDYKTYLEERYRGRIQEINFRNKDAGWRNTSLKVNLDTGIYRKNMQEDPFYILFFSHLIIRPSCHQCVYASYHRPSDITLADFWGVENAHKSFQDDLGITLMLANTRKGRMLVEQVKTKADLVKSSHSAFYQPIFELPSKASSKREKFWQEYLTKGFKAALKKYGKLTLLQCMIKKIAVPVLKKSGLYQLIARVYFK